LDIERPFSVCTQYVIPIHMILEWRGLIRQALITTGSDAASASASYLETF
jgi:hypothetical protein